MKTILVLSVISITILACGDTDDNSPPIIIHRVATPDPVDAPSDFPEVPEGFPENLTPVWLEEHFDEQSHSAHVIMYRVLIELWNQGDHGFVNAIMDPVSRKVYPLYRHVVYVRWVDAPNDIDRDGKPMKHIGGCLGTPPHTGRLCSGLQGKALTEKEVEEMMAGEGDFMAKHPGLKLVDRDKAGYKPKDVLVDYCNQPGNRARVPYCR